MWSSWHDPTFSRFDTVPACERQTWLGDLSPFSAKIGYIRNKVLGGDLVPPG